jgi:hypothetical protein
MSAPRCAVNYKVDDVAHLYTRSRVVVGVGVSSRVTAE